MQQSEQLLIALERFEPNIPAPADNQKTTRAIVTFSRNRFLPC